MEGNRIALKRKPRRLYCKFLLPDGPSDASAHGPSLLPPLRHPSLCPFPSTSGPHQLPSLSAPHLSPLLLSGLQPPGAICPSSFVALSETPSGWPHMAQNSLTCSAKQPEPLLLASWSPRRNSETAASPWTWSSRPAGSEREGFSTEMCSAPDRNCATEVAIADSKGVNDNVCCPNMHLILAIII